MSYLHRKNVSGETWTISSEKTWEWKITDLSGETGYDEDTSILNLNFILEEKERGEQPLEVDRDVKFLRDIIKSLVEQKAVDVTLGTETDNGNISSPSTGDTYLVGTPSVKGFRYKEGKIAEWDGATWIFKSKEQAGFDLCNAAEKQVCLTYKIGTHAQRVSVAADMYEMVETGLDYHASMVGIDFTAVRPRRLGIVISMVHNYTEHIFVEMNQTLTATEDNSALSVENDPPSSPSFDDKVIVGNDGTGVFDGNEKDVATYENISGGTWTFKKRVFLSMPEFMLGLIKAYDYLNTYMLGVIGKGREDFGDRVDGIGNFIDCNYGSMWHISEGNVGIRNFGYIPAIGDTPEGLDTWGDFADILLDVITKGIFA